MNSSVIGRRNTMSENFGALTPCLRSLRRLDMFGAPININFKSKSSHQTYLGALCTLVVYPFLILMVLYLIVLFDYNSQDMIFSSSEIYPFSDPGDGIQLNQTGDPQFSFKLYVNDITFDNDDNPYGNF